MKVRNLLDSFEGNKRILLVLFIAGIFMPPLLAFAAVYLLAKRYDHDPMVIDDRLLAFFLVLLGHLVFIGIVVRDNIANVFKVAVLGTIVITLVVYPFIFLWIRYDFQKHNKRIRGIRDTKFGRFVRKKYENVKGDLKQKRKSKKLKVKKV